VRIGTIKPAKGATRERKHHSISTASGLGGTAGRGHKGQLARSGGKVARWFEGGQMPIQRRIPKRGFKNIHRQEYKVFNLGQLDLIVEKYGITEFTPENLYVNGLISQTDRVKILGVGELKSKLSFKVHAVSGKAKAALEAAGGTIEILK